MSALPLFDAAPDDPLERAFKTFHAAHPEVYDELVRLARLAVARGRDRYGMKALFEIARWQRVLARSDDEPFKLNNNFTSAYSREIMARERDLAGFFETRTTRAERDEADDMACGPVVER